MEFIFTQVILITLSIGALLLGLLKILTILLPEVKKVYEFYSTKQIALFLIVCLINISAEQLQNAVLFKLARSILFINLSILIWPLISGMKPLISKHFDNHKYLNESIIGFIFKIIEVLIIIATSMNVLEIWGINMMGLLAGFGIAGMAIALAAQDTIKNVFGSITIFFDQAFVEGEMIRFNQLDGVVEKIGFRTTFLRQQDSSLVSIPNSTISSSIIINLSRKERSNIQLIMSINPNTDLEKIENLLSSMFTYINSAKEISLIPDLAHYVRIAIISRNSLDINCCFFSAITSTTEVLALKELCMKKFLQIVAEQKIELPSNAA